jgi:glycyl-tRNA synthetase
MFEHCYYARDGDDKRSVFKFTPAIAPVKATVFPLLARPEMRSAATALAAEITAAGVSNIVDTTATTIGRRYARTDEIGVPFGVTVDGQTAEDGTATVRERDSMAQVRVPVADLPSLLRSLVDGKESWADVAARFPAQEPPKE